MNHRQNAIKIRKILSLMKSPDGIRAIIQMVKGKTWNKIQDEHKNLILNGPRIKERRYRRMGWKWCLEHDEPRTKMLVFTIVVFVAMVIKHCFLF